MSSVTLHSFAELGEYFDSSPALPAPTPVAEAGSDGPGPVAPDGEDAVGPAPADLATLLDRLASAGAVLATLVRADQEARAAAADQLARYDALTRERRQADEVLAQARQVRGQADALAADAFSEEGRSAAVRVIAVATEAEEAADRLVVRRRAEMEALAAEPALARLLEERRQEEQRRAAASAAAESARRLREGLDAVEHVLAAGQLEEAEGLLRALAKDYPDSAEVNSLQSIIARRGETVKSSVASEALRLARRAYRRAPADAIARLEALDLAGLPEHLRHQITGLWAAACARLCRERGDAEPRLRYLPQPGVGVVVAREAAGQPYVVVSALGADLPAGTLVDQRLIQSARPLRATGR